MLGGEGVKLNDSMIKTPTTTCLHPSHHMDPPLIVRSDEACWAKMQVISKF